MRFFLSFFMFLFSLNANPTNKCVSINEFSNNQKEIIAYAYNYGKKYNLGYTLAAIAWHESCAGEYRMNFADPSAGLYHALIPGVIKRYQMLKDNGFNRNVIGELLIRDDEFASKVAIDELLYWDNVRNGNWKEIIKSYNKGFSWEKDYKLNMLAENYYKNIKEKKEILENYIPKHLSNFKLKKRQPMLSEYSNLKNIDEKQSTKIQIAQKIRRIEIAKLNSDDKLAIKEAKDAKKAIISVYKTQNGNMIHQETISIKPIYIEQR
ncbi:hypothetical protein [Helicobacter sp. MIT 14-3879]|uniref:hypothetical protein n=1 Tax=Helicobacter sp. MIT 14-3879 TaxID=2040649 RepID=UPI000E1F8296|nr:hypothetical protein [Helicobacter sp. MIT 14-3879]RDU64744.1 hypothetical protein CQA44_03265 [Helicobacter sp. MIT 14-3879]